MSKVQSKGYFSPFSYADEKQAFLAHIPWLIEDAQSLLANTEVFKSFPGDFAHTSWPYISGDGPLCLGLLLLGWQNGVLCDRCDACGSVVYVFRFAGSPLSGRNSFSGYCVTCQAEVRQQSAGHVFLARVKFILSHNKHQARLRYTTGG